MFVDRQGIEYENSDFKTIKLAPSGLKKCTIVKQCENIPGGETVSQSSFILCKNTLQHVDFEPNSALINIGCSVFSYFQELLTVNFGNCGHLEYLNENLFRGSKQLNSVTLPPTLKSLSKEMFRDCTSLTSLSIPDTVTTFRYCCIHSSGITSLEISPNTQMNYIQNEAFSSTKLTTFFVGKSITQLDGSMFMASPALTGLVFHEENKNFQYIDKTVYNKDMTAVLLTFVRNKKIVLPETVTSLNFACFREVSITGIEFKAPQINFIGSWALSGTAMTEFTFPNGITSIPGECMVYSNRLTTVHLTPSIVSIGYRAFGNCPLLSSIDLMNVKQINESVFINCPELINIKIPASVTFIGEAAFSKCPNIKIDCTANNNFLLVDGMFFINEKKTLSEYFGSGGDVVVPSNCDSIGKNTFTGKDINKVTFNGLTKLNISNNAFESSKIKEIEFPACLVEIGVECFMGCDLLTKVTFAECEITLIPEKCFFGCTKLNTLNLPTSVTKIDKSAFARCKQLKTLDLQNIPIMRIESDAFEECGITSYNFNAALSYIGDSAFSKSGATNVDFSKTGLNTINQFTFNQCKDLSSVTFSPSTSTIGPQAFFECEKLSSVSFPKVIETIDVSAFESCVALETVKLEKDCNLAAIKGRAFYNCPLLTKIELDPDDTKFKFEQGALLSFNLEKFIFYLPTSQASIYVIPANVNIVGPYAFDGCTNIKTVIIPDGKITEIQYRAFAGCSKLSFIYLPKTITTVGNDAFLGCVSLKCGSVFTAGDKTLEDKLAEKGVDRIAFSKDCPQKSCPSVCSFSINRLATAMIFFLTL